MPEKPGFQIGSRFYPFPSSFRLGDPVLVEELTGLDWNAFLERLPDEDDPADENADPAAMLGLVGVAVWQQNPRWRRDKVVRYVQGLDMGDVEAIGDEDEAGEERPPEQPAETPEETAAGQPGSDSSASSSRSGSESPSEPSSPTGSGDQTSAT